jgi:hypothetical protein
MKAPAIKQAAWPDGRPRSTGNAFDVLYRPREKLSTAPRQTKPRARMTAREKTLKALQDNTGRSIIITKQADADRTARIKGGR